MVQKMCVLPVRCERCKSLFDLWYDLQEQEKNKEVVLGDGGMAQMFNQSLCWQCRGDAVGRFREHHLSEYELDISFE